MSSESEKTILTAADVAFLGTVLGVDAPAPQVDAEAEVKAKADEAQAAAEAEAKAQAEAKVMAEAEAKAKKEADVKAQAEADAAADAAKLAAIAAMVGKKFYRPTKGFAYVDTEQNVRFEPGESVLARMTSWLDAQIKAGYIVEVAE